MVNLKVFFCAVILGVVLQANFGDAFLFRPPRPRNNICLYVNCGPQATCREEICPNQPRRFIFRRPDICATCVPASTSTQLTTSSSTTNSITDTANSVSSTATSSATTQETDNTASSSQPTTQ